MAKCVEKLNRQPLLEILNNINVIIIQARLSSLKSAGLQWHQKNSHRKQNVHGPNFSKGMHLVTKSKKLGRLRQDTTEGLSRWS